MKEDLLKKKFPYFSNKSFYPWICIGAIVLFWFYLSQHIEKNFVIVFFIFALTCLICMERLISFWIYQNNRKKVLDCIIDCFNNEDDFSNLKKKPFVAIGTNSFSPVLIRAIQRYCSTASFYSDLKDNKELIESNMTLVFFRDCVNKKTKPIPNQNVFNKKELNIIEIYQLPLSKD